MTSSLCSVSVLMAFSRYKRQQQQQQQQFLGGTETALGHSSTATPKHPFSTLFQGTNRPNVCFVPAQH